MLLRRGGQDRNHEVEVPRLDTGLRGNVRNEGRRTTRFCGLLRL